MFAAIDFVLKTCEIYVIVYIILSLLAGYGVKGTDQRWFVLANNFFARSLDPVLRPLRVVLPKLRVDPAPPVLVIIILAVRYGVTIYSGPAMTM
jgi:uncharacterized protein YggT (Ycf19 family)